MTRKKVKLAFIANDSARKATFKKRKKGLMKKVDELCTLCGIDACAIVYSPYDGQPDVWPSPEGVQHVLSEFRMLPEMDQSKKMVNQEGFLRQRISKAADHLNRQKKDNREKEMTEVIYQCLVGNMGMFHLSFMDLRDLGFLIDQFLRDINRRAGILRKSSSFNHAESSSAAAAAAAAATAATAVTTAATTNPHQDYQTMANVYDRGGPSTTAVDPTVQKNQQQWYTELVNHPEQMSFIAEEIGFPFMDTAAAVTTSATAVAAPTTTAAAAASNVWASGFFQ